MSTTDSSNMCKMVLECAVVNDSSDGPEKY